MGVGGSSAMAKRLLDLELLREAQGECWLTIAAMLVS